jgi:DNA-binding NarL/FixJ family response regulator
MNMNAEVAADAFRRGAAAYLPKHAAASELVTAVRDVLRNRSYLSALITKDTVTYLLRSGKSCGEEDRITKRQREVLQLLAEGHSMKEVAYTLNVKTGTVAFHKYRIMATLGLKTNAELVQYAIKHNMIS